MSNVSVLDTGEATGGISGLVSDPLVEIRGIADRYERKLRRDVQHLRKTDKTVNVYMSGVQQFIGWLGALDIVPPVAGITTEVCESYMDYLVATERKPSTQVSRYGIIRAWFTWAVSKNIVATNPMSDVECPALPRDKGPDVFTEAKVKAMFATCEGESFAAVRNLAILRLFNGTGCRLAELTTLQYNPTARFDPNEVPHLDIASGCVHVAGKGSKQSHGARWRSVDFDADTAEAVDDYLAVRETYLREHRMRSDDLWLSERTGKAMTTKGLTYVVETAGLKAGIGHVHPHQWRHTHVDKLLREGKLSEGVICKRMGWDARAMLDRYARSNASERARESFRKAYC